MEKVEKNIRKYLNGKYSEKFIKLILCMLEVDENKDRVIFRCNDRFKVILVSPPHIAESMKDSWLGDSFGYENACKVSSELSGWYKSLSEMYGTYFIDAAEHVKASDSDGCHLDADNQQRLGSVIAGFIQEIS